MIGGWGVMCRKCEKEVDQTETKGGEESLVVSKAGLDKNGGGIECDDCREI